MGTNEFVYTISLNDAEILRTLQKIDSRLEGFGDKGVKSINRVQRATGRLNIAMGNLAATAITKLVSSFLNLAKAGVNTFVQINKEALKMAGTVQTAGITFANLFQGGGLDEAAGLQASEAFLVKLRQLSDELGVNFADLSLLSRTILPEVESLDQFEELVDLMVILDRSDPDKTLDDVRIAFENIISGDPQGARSLQARFDIPLPVIKRLKEAQKELGPVAGLIQELGGFLADTGRNLEDFEETFSVSTERLKTGVRNLGVDLAEPILGPLTDEINDLNAFIEENRDELRILASIIGEMTLAAGQFVASGFVDDLNSLDVSDLVGQAEDAFASLQQILAFLETLNGVRESIEQLNPHIIAMNLFTDAAAEANIEWEITWRDINEVLVIAGGVLIGFGSILTSTIQQLGIFSGVIAASLSGDFETGNELAASMLSVQEIIAEAREEYNQFKEEGIAALDDADSATEAFQGRVEELREALADVNEEGLLGADVALKTRAARDVVEELTEAEKELADAVAETNAEFEERVNDATLDFLRATAKLERDRAERSIDIERKTLRKIRDLRKKFVFDLAGIQDDLEQDRADTVKEHSEELLDIQEEETQKRLDILLEFNRKRRAIELEFDEAARDALLSGSAFALLQAQRNRQKGLDEAAQSRDDNLADEKTDAQQRIEEAKKNLAEERDLAQERANQAEDELRRRLEFEVEKTRQHSSDQQEDLEISNKRRKDELRISYDLELIDLEESNKKKLAEIEGQHSAEIELLRAHLEALSTIRKKDDNEISRSERIRFRRPSRGRTGPPAGFDPFNQLTFDHGGVVPGPIGAPIGVLAHGGETIIPTHKPEFQGMLRNQGSTSTSNDRTVNMGGVQLGAFPTPQEEFLTMQNLLQLVKRGVA